MAVGELYSVHKYPEEYGPALFERWNGTTWSVLPGNADSGPRVQLTGVSCTGISFCMATGTNLEGPNAAVFDSWNGKIWSNVPGAAAQPIGGSGIGVSCTGASQCVAVGYGGGQTGTNPNLIETWDGTTWSLAMSPDDVQGLGVSCASGSQCLGVGITSPQQHAMEEVWNGSVWALQSSPTLSPSVTVLNAVSCPDMSLCMAVGRYQVQGIQFTLAEVLDGGEWEVLPTPND